MAENAILEEKYQAAVSLMDAEKYIAAANAFDELGKTYYSLKDYTKAIEWYKKAIEVDKKYVEAYVDLGITYFAQENFDDAYISFQDAIQVNKEYAYIRKIY